jgi:hypothetical protein
MDPKTDSELPVIEVEAEAPAPAPKKPATLGRMAITKVTPEELAARRKADEEEEAKKREARKAKTGPAPAAAQAPALTAPNVPVSIPNASAPTAPNAVPEPAAGVEYSPARGPILAQLMEAALPLLGAEGKHLSGLCALASKLAQQLGSAPEGVALVPCAVQALYIASQLDRRGPYTPPELATLQKLLGPSWAELGPLVEPCAKGMLSKSKWERPEMAAVAAAICFFNHTRNLTPPAQVAKAAFTTLRNQKWIPADAIDALATAIAG